MLLSVTANEGGEEVEREGIEGEIERQRDRGDREAEMNVKMGGSERGREG